MGHKDPLMTLRVDTDVTGARPQTRRATPLEDNSKWVEMRAAARRQTNREALLAAHNQAA